MPRKKNHRGLSRDGGRAFPMHMPTNRLEGPLLPLREGHADGSTNSSRGLLPYAALRFAWISLRLIRHSAICTALSAAPLRRLSDTTHIDRPFSTVASSRMRLM